MWVGHGSRSQRFKIYSQTGTTVCGESLDAHEFIRGSGHLVTIVYMIAGSLVILGDVDDGLYLDFIRSRGQSGPVVVVSGSFRIEEIQAKR